MLLPGIYGRETRGEEKGQRQYWPRGRVNKTFMYKTCRVARVLRILAGEDSHYYIFSIQRIFCLFWKLSLCDCSTSLRDKFALERNEEKKKWKSNMAKVQSTVIRVIRAITRLVLSHAIKNCKEARREFQKWLFRLIWDYSYYFWSTFGNRFVTRLIIREFNLIFFLGQSWED